MWCQAFVFDIVCVALGLFVSGVCGVRLAFLLFVWRQVLFFPSCVWRQAFDFCFVSSTLSFIFVFRSVFWRDRLTHVINRTFHAYILNFIFKFRQ